MTNKYNFSVIKALRKRLNLTLEKLAEVSGLTYSTVAGIETNKSSPSLKTLDALSESLQISTGNLISLAENRLVQIRDAKVFTPQIHKTDMIGLEKCRIASYDKAKIIRVELEKDEVVKVMGVHENCHEFCYVLNGTVKLTLSDKDYYLEENKTILFDAMLTHSYTGMSPCEFMTVHIPKDIRAIASMLES